MYALNNPLGRSCGPGAPVSNKALDFDDPLVSGIRHQLKVLLEEEKFSLKTLRKIAHVATCAQEMLGHLDSKSLTTADEFGEPPEGDSMGDETFGAQTMRSMATMFGSIGKPGPDVLVSAIVKAKANGMMDLAASMEAELKASFGGIPNPRKPSTYHVNEDPIIVSRELPPAPSADPIAVCTNEEVTA